MTGNCCYILKKCDCNAYFCLKYTFNILKISFITSDQETQDTSAHDKSNNPVLITCAHQSKAINKVTALKYKAVIAICEDNTKPSLPEPHLILNVPFSIYELKNLLRKIDLPSESSEHDDQSYFSEFIGESTSIKKIKQIIRQVANSDSSILIQGQSGTGKEVVASYIHRLSNRHDKPFVPVNCGAIPSELMESELFGHEKGSFTGATNKRAGRFELANSGTLFLDEIGDMPLLMQVKLLRVIQDKKIERIGSTSSIDVNVRIIAATNKQLENMVMNNTFREDLYYRLNVIPIYMPALHERASDIPLLVNYQLDKIKKRIPHDVFFSDEAMQAISEHTWPGNIRELANFIERMVVLYQDKVIVIEDVAEQLNKIKSKPQQFALSEPTESFNLKTYISNVEKKLINIALEKSNGTISAAAEYLNLKRTTLIEKMKKYKLVTE